MCEGGNCGELLGRKQILYVLMDASVLSVKMKAKFYELFSSNGMAQGGIVFFAATGVASVSNFAFHMVVSRVLGPSSYGAFGALLNLLLVLSVPLTALQAFVTRAESANLSSKGCGLALRPILGKAVAVGVLGTVLLLGLSQTIADYLHLNSSTAVVVLSLWAVPAVVGTVVQGILIGRLRFVSVSLATVVGGIGGRLALGVALVEMGFGVTGAIAASVLGQLILTLIMLGLLAPEILRPLGASERRIGIRGVAFSMLAFGGYWAFASEDTILARHFLPSSSAGLYASASTAGKIALFLPAAVGLIAFPRFARDRGLGELSRSTLRWALSLTTVLGLGSAVILVVFPSVVIDLLFGHAYLRAAGTVRILGIEAAGLGVLSLLIYFQLARESLDFLYVWVGAFVGFLGISVIHGSPASIATVMLVSVAITTVAMVLRVVHVLLREPLIDEAALRGKPLFEDVQQNGGCELTIVVPYYNPGLALRNHICSLVETMSSRNISYEIIAVSDGSTDGSPDMLLGLFPSVLRSNVLEKNFGKGQALRVGLMEGSGKFLGFIDADGDIPATEIASLFDAMKESGADIITGSKRHPRSVVYYPALRRVYSWGYQQLVRMLFHLSVKDTQTGLKIVKREVVSKALPLMVEKRFAFDLELFVVAKKLGYRNVVEEPVVIQRRFSSTISFGSVRAMLIDTLGIFYRLKVTKFYDRQEIGPVPEQASRREIAKEPRAL